MQTTESAAKRGRRTHGASQAVFIGLICCLLAIAANWAPAKDPVVKPLGPPQIQFRGVYVITAVSTPFQLEVPASAPIYWRYPKGVKANYESGKPGKALLEISELPAGDSTFEADCWQDGKLTVRKITVRNGMAPRPPPVEDDDDDENPPQGFTSVVIVEETEDRTQAQSKLINVIQAKDQGFEIRVIDQDQRNDDFRSAVELAKSRGLPSVVFCGDDWEPKSAEPLPKTLEEWNKLVKERQK